MQQLKNLSAIDTNTLEGRYLIAAMSMLLDTPTSNEPYSGDTTNTMLDKIHKLAETLYEDAGDIPSRINEKQSFQVELTTLINRHSLENGSDTPDFILAQHLYECLVCYQRTITARDKWFGVDMWTDEKKIKKTI